MKASKTYSLAAAVLLLLTGTAVFALGGRALLFGALLCWGGALLCAMLALSEALPPHAARRLRRTLAGLVLASCALLGGLEAMIITNADSQITGDPEVLVVLGAKLWDHAPSPMLQARLQVAYDYLSDHPTMTVVVTGGHGTDEPRSEAACMAEYLTGRGINPSRILLEEQASNTMQNLQFTARLLTKAGYSTDHLLVVSNGAHLARVKLLARRNGLSISTLSAPTPGKWSYRVYFYLREGAALVKSWLFDRGNSHA